MDIRRFWAKLSIRRKTLVWLVTLILVLLSVMGISAAVQARATAVLTGHPNRGATRPLPVAEEGRGASGRGRCATQPHRRQGAHRAPQQDSSILPPAVTIL